MSDDPLVAVEDVEKYYYEHDSVLDRLLSRGRQPVKAVDGISFAVREGETLGLVGESGCGKSTAGETVLNLREPTGGTVRFDGQPIGDMDSASTTAFRKRAGIVFQDPLSSLNPRMTADQIIREPLEVHDVGADEDRAERVDELLERVGLSVDQRDRYPHEFSGGQQQRIAVARALALEPDFLVLDEPVSALDVSVQAQILNLLADLQEDFGLTYLFIAHDLSVVRHITDRVAVMYLGEIVETGATQEIFEDPKHPYTKALLESVPRAEVEEYDRDVDVLEGDVPSPRNPPSGCRFRTRCPKVIPPDSIDVEQATFREIMDYRERLESGELTPADAREMAEEAAEDDDEDDERDDLDGDGPEDGGEDDEIAIVPTLRDELFSVPIHGENEATIEASLEQLTDGDREAAIETLRERFESVCETQRPVLQEQDHPAACHLFDQPSTDANDETTDRTANAPDPQ